ncbi:MAG: multiheme c-type cytochrome [Candidatus Omnitrophota bacterium]
MIRFFSAAALSFCFILNAAANQVVLIATSQTHSSFERCGCSGHYQGGLEARAAYLDKLAAENVPYILIDAGGFLPNETAPIDAATGKSYFGAMKELKYDLALLGPPDLALGQIYLKNLASQSVSPMLLSSNLELGDESFWAPSTAIIRDGVKIGFVGASSFRTMRAGGFSILPADKTITDQIRILREKENPDAIVLLAYEPSNLVRSWLAQHQELKIDLAITLDLGQDLEKQGETYIANAPQKGYQVGKIVLDVAPGKGIETAVYSRETIDAQWRNEAMRAYIKTAYENMIDELNLKISGPIPLQNFKEEENPSHSYVGAKTCRGCHEAQYNQWEQTVHARAFDLLLDKNRQWIPQWLSRCVTGYGSKTGFQSYPETLSFLNVQCETCHGPGSSHIEGAASGPIRRVPPKELCLECHDRDFSPKFDVLFDLYYKQIVH